jgi:mannose-1-phosphate guanylyltransferase
MILPADHHIPDAAAFARVATRAAGAAAEGWIVTLGVPPTGASSRYGYIVPGEDAAGGRRIGAFIEKPAAAQARALAAEGGLWNCGVFFARADVLLADLAEHAPHVHAAAGAALADGTRRGRTLRLGPAALAAPAIGFDHAVMEATRRGLVIPCDFSWSDLGTWDAVLAAATRDDDGNHAVGHVALDRTRECIVRAADGMTAVVVGGQRLAVIVERDEVLVCDLARAEGLKSALARAGSISAGRR